MMVMMMMMNVAYSGLHTERSVRERSTEHSANTARLSAVVSYLIIPLNLPSFTFPPVL